MNLAELKLRREQNLQMSEAIKEQGVLGFKGISLRFANVNHVHVVSVPKVWEETIQQVAVDLKDEADALVSAIEAEQKIYDNFLASAKEVESVDLLKALELYNKCQAMDFKEELQIVIKAIVTSLKK